MFTVDTDLFWLTETWLQLGDHVSVRHKKVKAAVLFYYIMLTDKSMSLTCIFTLLSVLSHSCLFREMQYPNFTRLVGSDLHFQLMLNILKALTPAEVLRQMSGLQEER